jgi:hypothetical protein
VIVVIQLPSAVSRNTAAAINSLLAAYNTENLRHSLSTYPKRIKDQREKVQQARAAYRQAEQSRAEAEASLILDISIATDDKGKAKYTNAEARSAALAQCKRNDPDYREAAAAVTAAEAALTEAQDTLTQIIDEYVSARAASNLVAAEMKVIAGLLDVDEVEDVKIFPVPEGSQAEGSQATGNYPKSKEVF